MAARDFDGDCLIAGRHCWHFGSIEMAHFAAFAWGKCFSALRTCPGNLWHFKRSSCRSISPLSFSGFVKSANLKSGEKRGFLIAHD